MLRFRNSWWQLSLYLHFINKNNLCTYLWNFSRWYIIKHIFVKPIVFLGSSEYNIIYLYKKKIFWPVTIKCYIVTEAIWYRGVFWACSQCVWLWILSIGRFTDNSKHNKTVIFSFKNAFIAKKYNIKNLLSPCVYVFCFVNMYIFLDCLHIHYTYHYI